MAFLAAVTYAAAILSFGVGHLWRLDLGAISLPLIDISLVLLSLVIFVKSTKHPPSFKLVLFLALSLINLALQSLVFESSAAPFLYWLRFSLWFYLINLPARPIIPRLPLLIVNIVFVGVGFVQYFIYPYLGPLTAQNWDPHLNRLVGSLLDPAFTGLCLLLMLIYVKTLPGFKLKSILLFFTYLALALTYSRASFLALVVTAAYAGLTQKQWSTFLKTLVLVAATLLLLPRPPGEGTKLERTSTIKAKVINYQQALSLISRYPLTGVGYNRLGFYRTEEKPASHARWGFDNSFLNILAGNGLVLFALFCLLFAGLWRFSTLEFRYFLLPVIVHSFFSNSLVYPFIMYLLLAAKYRK